MAELPIDPEYNAKRFRILQIESGMYRQFDLGKAKMEEVIAHNQYAWKLHGEAMSLRAELGIDHIDPGYIDETNLHS